MDTRDGVSEDRDDRREDREDTRWNVAVASAYKPGKQRTNERQVRGLAAHRAGGGGVRRLSLSPDR